MYYKNTLFDIAAKAVIKVVVKNIFSNDKKEIIVKGFNLEESINKANSILNLNLSKNEKRNLIYQLNKLNKNQEIQIKVCYNDISFIIY